MIADFPFAAPAAAYAKLLNPAVFEIINVSLSNLTLSIYVTPRRCLIPRFTTRRARIISLARVHFGYLLFRSVSLKVVESGAKLNSGGTVFTSKLFKASQRFLKLL